MKKKKKKKEKNKACFSQVLPEDKVEVKFR